MNIYRALFLVAVAILFSAGLSCSKSGEQSNVTVTQASPNASPKPVVAAANNLTPSDISKLKWIEGTWRGMDGDKPFYERYKIENTAMIVESLKEDGSPDGEPERFELKNGEFGINEGEKRSVASEISDSHVQFVPTVAGKGNNFRFEHQSDGTWIALLEWPPTADKPARQKIYKMEPWQPKK